MRKQYDVLLWQAGFDSADIQKKTMKTMDTAARAAMTPDYELFEVDLKEGSP